MKFQIIAAGKPALAYAKAGIEEYRKRLRRYGSFELHYIKAGDSQTVSRELFRRSEGTLRVVMDERGKQPTTSDFVAQVSAWELRGEIKTISFLIGASDGHTEELRSQADLVWALSPLTYQHELALVVLLEQLYRVQTIKRGEPYHR